ncbi:MAG: hypothetical protein AB8G16_01425 [Gammaproteobacteria bacterium]
MDNFESAESQKHWQHIDVDNQTEPLVPNPQVAEVRLAKNQVNHFLIKKPAEDGIVGNRKALSYVRLPQALDVGQTATFYTRVNVEYFPNNHSFGLSNLTAEGIAEKNYNAFEPMIRITDKRESNGYKNDGTLMVMVEDRAYAKIINPETGEPAEPMQSDIWYELWYVVNNATKASGGQSYDVYIRGGEFEIQQRVFSGASFRMQREQPLINFIAICNTGSKDKPYGNGGVRYDDIYMASGTELTTPN